MVKGSSQGKAVLVRAESRGRRSDAVREVFGLGLNRTGAFPVTQWLVCPFVRLTAARQPPIHTGFPTPDAVILAVPHNWNSAPLLSRAALFPIPHDRDVSSVDTVVIDEIATRDKSTFRSVKRRDTATSGAQPRANGRRRRGPGDVYPGAAR